MSNEVSTFFIIIYVLLLKNATYGAENVNISVNDNDRTTFPTTTRYTTTRYTTKGVLTNTFATIISVSTTEPSTVPPPISKQNETDIACEGNCVRKCCGPEFIFAKQRNPCIKPPAGVELWFPENIENPKFVYGYPFPKENENCLQHLPDEYSLNSDGTIQMVNDLRVVDYNAYCLDVSIEDDKVIEFAAICIKKITKDLIDLIADKFHLAGCIITCISLVLLLIVEFLIIKRTGDFTSKCLVSMTVAMFFAYVTLIINNSPAIINITKPNCITLAICQQFFFYSFYFWLNVKCFEIWRIIRGSVMGLQMQFLGGTHRRYIFYSIYAWGVPFLISSITLTMQLVPQDSNSLFVRPRIAEGRCWFRESWPALFSYYYGGQIVIHTMNVLFIAQCGYLMYFKRQKVANIGESRVHSSKDCLKKFWQQFYILSVIVVIWTMDSVTLIYPRQRFWRIIDFLNTLQGFYLLILVVLRDKNIIKKLKSVCTRREDDTTPLSSTVDTKKTSVTSIELSELPSGTGSLTK